MNKNKGFTLIEVMVVLAIVGVVGSFAVPSFNDMVQRNKLKAAVQAFQDDVQFARTQAIKRSVNILINRVQTSAAAGNWCYGLTAKSAGCTCTTANDCEIKTVSGTGFNTVSMYSATGNSTFDFRRGTIGQNGVTFNTTKYAARVVFSTIGRVRICTPPVGTGATDRPTGTIGLSEPDKPFPNC